MGTSAIERDRAARSQPGMPGNMQAPPSPFLGVIPPWMWDRAKKLWTMPFTAITNLAAAGQAQATTTIDTSYFYVGYFASGTVRANAAGKAIQTGFPLTVSLATANNRQFQPAGLANDFNNLFGTAQQPAVWALPMILEPGDILTATVTNNHNATAVDVALMLMGFLVKE